MTTPTTPISFRSTSIATCPGAPKKVPPYVCKYYLTSTGCKNGETCRYTHNQPQLLPSPPCKFVLTENGCTNIGCYLPHPLNRAQPVPRADPSTISCKAEAKFMKLQGVGCSQSLNPKCPFLHTVERAA